MRGDGALTIEGHDLGETPRSVWGSSEYEWTMAIAKEQLPAFVDALGGQAGSDALDLMSTRYREDERVASRGFLDEQGINFSFWSRVGD
jgi:hypothetical protein